MPMADAAIMTPASGACAGDFLAWLDAILASFSSGQGAVVPCGDCRACCRAGYFIPVRHHEWATLAVIPRGLLVHPPGTSGEGDYLIGTTRRGDCAMLRPQGCPIYARRPQACRNYDCRIFTAAGIPSGHDAIDRQAGRWRFQYGSDHGWLVHAAVKQAARFVIDHARAFPGGRVPEQAADIALVALKAHPVFLGPMDGYATDAAVARAVVHACRVFDATGRLVSGGAP